MTYSPTKLHGGQVRRWRQQLVTRSIAESDAAWGATKAPSPGEEANKVKGQRSKRKATVNLSHFSFHILPI